MKRITVREEEKVDSRKRTRLIPKEREIKILKRYRIFQASNKNCTSTFGNKEVKEFCASCSYPGCATCSGCSE